jgi:hypothetical protein
MFLTLLISTVLYRRAPTLCIRSVRFDGERFTTAFHPTCTEPRRRSGERILVWFHLAMDFCAP